MANKHVRYWGARQKAQSDTVNFKQVEETVPEWKLFHKHERAPFNFLWFLGAFAGWGCSLHPVPTQGRHYSGAQPTFRTSKHTTHQPRSHPLTTERFPIPERRMAPFTSNQSSISVQQKVWDIILECDVIRADPEVYALTTLSFLSFETEIYDRRAKDRDRRADETLLGSTEQVPRGTCFWPLFAQKADQVRKAAQLPLVYKFIPFLDFSLWKHKMPQQWWFH